jgi:hypothetical protein
VIRKIFFVSIILSFSIIYTVVGENSQNDHSLKFDCYGKVSSKGKSQEELLVRIQRLWRFSNFIEVSKDKKNVRFMDWEILFFIENNKELIHWEINKYIKTQVFKLPFFDKKYYNSYSYDGILTFLLRYPGKADDFAKLLFANSYCNYFYNDEESLTLFILERFGDIAKLEYNKLKEKMQRNRKKIETDYLRRYLLKYTFDARTEKEKAYNHLLKRFQSGALGPNINPEIYKRLVENWDITKTLRYLLENKMINEKNKYAFYDLLAKLETCPDDIIEKIIEYWGLGSNKGLLALDSGIACTKCCNSKLRKTILPNLNKIKIPKYPNAADYAIMLYLHGADSVWRKIPAIGSRVSSIILNYARLSGDYNKAYKLAFFLNQRIFTAFSPTHAFYLCVNMLYEKGNLSDSNARKVLDILTAKSSKYDCPRNSFNRKENVHLYSHYAKLLTVSDFKGNSRATQALASLSSPEDIDKSLLQALVSNKNYQKQYPKAYSESLKFLNKEKINNSLEFIITLDGLSALPQLIKFLENKPSEKMICTICDKLKSMSIYGKPAAPTLRKFIQQKDINFYTRINIMFTLAEIGDKESIPLIKKYAYNKNKLLEKAARQSLYILQNVNENDEFFEIMLKPEIRQKWYR